MQPEKTFKTCHIEISIQEKELQLDIPITPSVRKPEELKPVAHQPEALEGMEEPLYYMYRNVWELNPKCDQLCKKHDLRYDITVIRNGLIGEEYIKTLGHFHEKIKAKNVTYPELYEVISGKAFFLIQKIDSTDFQVIKAKQGDHAFIPYNYGHVTVNRGKKPLIIGNLVADNFESDYQPVKEKHGFAYYVLSDGLVKNPHYDSPPQPTQRLATPGPPIDKQFKKDPQHYHQLLH